VKIAGMRAAKLRVLGLLMPAFFCGCILNPPKFAAVTEREAAAQKVEGTASRVAAYSGQQFTYALRSFVDPNSKNAIHQLQVWAQYRARACSDYHRLIDDRHNDLPFVIRARTKNSCAFETCDCAEEFTGDLTDDVLRRRASTGIEVQARADDGQRFTMFVSPEMIERQLNAVANTR
jgi:hypothetical protein